MKKYKFSSDKYKELKQKTIKKYTPNLPSTDAANYEAYEKMKEEMALELSKNSSERLEYVKHDKTKTLSVIVPYRNRKSHLEEFIEKIPTFLDNQSINYKITIVEQDNTKQFNKGLLNNIGFLQTKTFDYFCFHDVDMIPIDADYRYSKKNNTDIGMAIHLSKLVEQFNYKPLPGYFGGVVLVDNYALKLTNGYSNSYWGWGVEDDDFYRRCYNSNKVLTIFRHGVYRSLPHKHNYIPKIYDRNFETYVKNISPSSDGFLQAKYKIVSTDVITDKISIIKVSI